MRVKFANPPLDLGLKDHEPPHRTELKEKCSRLFKVQYSKLTRKKGNKNKKKIKQKKLGQKEWKLTAKEFLKPLHLSKSRMIFQSLLAHYLFIMKDLSGLLETQYIQYAFEKRLFTNESQDIITQYLRFNLKLDIMADIM